MEAAAAKEATPALRGLVSAVLRLEAGSRISSSIFILSVCDGNVILESAESALIAHTHPRSCEKGSARHTSGIPLNAAPVLTSVLIDHYFFD